jgi:lipopolysaccharide transport protein LptA
MNSHEPSSMAKGHATGEPTGKKHGGTPRFPTLATLLVLSLTAVVDAETAPDQAAALTTPAEIHIRADKAWEDKDADVLYLEGEFHMRTDDWEVRAERAEVHGPVEDPVKIVGYGHPASIRVTLGDDKDQGTGYSERIVYLYQTKMLELHQNARMEMDNVTVRSAAIIYDVGRKKLVSGGKEGVEFVLQTENAPAQ